ncbi:DUF2007 domain-containing protein [Kordia algicida OT-1]|uniref:DUF2007 domain-containing protein n=1 Tax=Kordia algicida OT-1 TaxID=391587 RepID=A9DRM4_9FLAO|nr:hypothetical protein [Kordia algicida]EDP96815.1 hypothetical protein KAOT1_16668 [Kordia algicida OT-1]
MTNFVTVATFTYPYEYAILRIVLDQRGIKYVFENELMLSVFPFYSNAIGGISLKVHKNDVDLTKQILIDFDTKQSHLRIV